MLLSGGQNSNFRLLQVRVFTFSVGQHNYDVTPLQWMACANKGSSPGSLPAMPTVRWGVVHCLSIFPCKGCLLFHLGYCLACPCPPLYNSASFYASVCLPADLLLHLSANQSVRWDLAAGSMVVPTILE